MSLLRSDQTRVEVEAARSSELSDCLSSNVGTISIGTSCGGERSGVRLSATRVAMMVSPNPAGSTIAVRIHNQPAHARIEVVSMSGQVVAVFNAAPTLDVTSLVRGLYTLRLVSDSGYHHAVQVLIAP